MQSKTIKFYTLSQQELDKVVEAVVRAVVKDIALFPPDSSIVPPPSIMISALTQQALRDLAKS